MAKFNEILVGRFNTYLLKGMGMKGEPPAPQLAGEIVPSINLFHGTEDRFLEGWQIFAVTSDFTPGVGVFNKFRIRNPVNSGVVAVICSLKVGSTANDVLLGSRSGQAADLASVLSSVTVALDVRTATGGGSQVACSQEATAGGIVGTPCYRIRLLANQPFELIDYEGQELPLAPNSSYDLQMTTANTGMTVTCMWRQRGIEESERQ